jgi:hypothetical protein
VDPNPIAATIRAAIQLLMEHLGVDATQAATVLHDRAHEAGVDVEVIARGIIACTQATAGPLTRGDSGPVGPPRADGEPQRHDSRRRG